MQVHSIMHRANARLWHSGCRLAAESAVQAAAHAAPLAGR